MPINATLTMKALTTEFDYVTLDSLDCMPYAWKSHRVFKQSHCKQSARMRFKVMIILSHRTLDDSEINLQKKNTLLWNITPWSIVKD